MKEKQTLEEKTFQAFNEKLPLELITKLISLGVEVIAIEYSGSGDSGDIDAVHYHTNPKFNYKKEEFDNYVKNLDSSIYDGVLSLINYDWYNNEGGAGVLYLDLLHGKYNVDGHYYITETQDASHGESTNLIKDARLTLGL